MPTREQRNRKERERRLQRIARLTIDVERLMTMPFDEHLWLLSANGTKVEIQNGDRMLIIGMMRARAEEELKVLQALDGQKQPSEGVTRQERLELAGVQP